MILSDFLVDVCSDKNHIKPICSLNPHLPKSPTKMFKNDQVLLVEFYHFPFKSFSASSPDFFSNWKVVSFYGDNLRHIFWGTQKFRKEISTDFVRIWGPGSIPMQTTAQLVSALAFHCVGCIHTKCPWFIHIKKIGRQNKCGDMMESQKKNVFGCDSIVIKVELKD